MNQFMTWIKHINEYKKKGTAKGHSDGKIKLPDDLSKCFYMYINDDYNDILDRTISVSTKLIEVCYLFYVCRIIKFFEIEYPDERRITMLESLNYYMYTKSIENTEFIEFDIWEIYQNLLMNDVYQSIREEDQIVDMDVIKNYDNYNNFKLDHKIDEGIARRVDIYHEIMFRLFHISNELQQNIHDNIKQHLNNNKPTTITWNYIRLTILRFSIPVILHSKVSRIVNGIDIINAEEYEHFRGFINGLLSGGKDKFPYNTYINSFKVFIDADDEEISLNTIKRDLQNYLKDIINILTKNLNAENFLNAISQPNIVMSIDSKKKQLISYLQSFSYFNNFKTQIQVEETEISKTSKYITLNKMDFDVIMQFIDAEIIKSMSKSSRRAHVIFNPEFITMTKKRAFYLKQILQKYVNNLSDFINTWNKLL